MSNSVWAAACRLLVQHFIRGERLDHVLETAPVQLTAIDRRRVRRLVYGVVRNLALLDHAIATHAPRKPRPMLRAVLLTGAFELLENADDAPVIVHHAVDAARELASANEARFVNAVLRRVPDTLRTITDAAPADVAGLALRYSHPRWLVARWLERLGLEATRALLAWNQQPAPVHARVIASTVEQSGPLPDFFRPTPWPGFFLLERPEWETVEALLAAGRIYLQDPATAIAPELLAVQPGETVLDLCAAPGGKSLQLAERAGPHGKVVAVDLSGPRLKRLRANLARHANLPVAVFAGDAAKLTLEQLASASLPPSYDAVLLDAPCSNTGVLRHRADAKWRLRPEDLAALANLQLAMLRRGATFVQPGGRIVYSTCSLEPEENEDIVQAFLDESGGEFALESSETSRPWESGRDGAGAFRLRRVNA